MSTTNEIMDLASEWAQETKDFGHLDESRPRDALLKAVEALAASCCTGRETMSLLKLDQSGCEIESVPPLVKWAKSAHLPPLTPTSTFQRFDGGKTVQAHTDAAMREYGELCRKMALEEAHAWMMQRHQAQKHRDNFMLIEADKFRKDLLVLP